jgi:hypothetical protein
LSKQLITASIGFACQRWLPSNALSPLNGGREI